MLSLLLSTNKSKSSNAVALTPLCRPLMFFHRSSTHPRRRYASLSLFSAPIAFNAPPPASP